MSIGNERELKGMKRAGRVVAMALKAARKAVRPGATTAEVDGVVLRVLEQHGARSAPALVYGFPGTACISVNEEAVHGIPGDRVLAGGDLVTLDVTVELDGYFADAAVTVSVPPADPVGASLAACAEAAFWKGAEAARAGASLNSVGAAVEAEVHRRGFRVLRDLAGHGIGRTIHEAPSVPNHFDPRSKTTLTEGLVFALEPIVSVGAERTRTLRDRWTLATVDGSLAAHHEHTLMITRGSPLLLTAAA